jgi:2-amino-4-hydroxy-6-hydroxymethyldihydropteridine diphosphokinase
MTASRAAIGLGANIGDAQEAIRAGFAHLDVLGSVVARSSLYATPPWGVVDQPPFVNACAILETVLKPVDLLRALKRIEEEMGRVATYRWGPRAIDLDILTYDELTIATADLTLPHPRMRERAFVLVPLAEIDDRYDTLLRALPAAERDAIRIIEE